MRQAVLSPFSFEKGALILQEWPLYEQTGCDWAKGVEEHSLEVYVYIE